MKYKLALFDLDGTLINSLADITNSINYVAEMYSLDDYDIDTIRKYIGNGARKLIERCFSPYGKSVEDALKKFREYYFKHLLDETYLYDGVVEVLEELINKGVLNILLTNKPSKYTNKIITKLGIKKYFKFVVCPETFNINKPDPVIIDKILQKYKFENNDVIIIGDSLIDIDTALNSKIDSCIVSYGFGDKDDFIKAGYIIDNISQLLDLFKDN